jgi:Leucine-rich repeat (LRR) protein
MDQPVWEPRASHASLPGKTSGAPPPPGHPQHDAFVLGTEVVQEAEPLQWEASRSSGRSSSASEEYLEEFRDDMVSACCAWALCAEGGAASCSSSPRTTPIDRPPSPPTDPPGPVRPGPHSRRVVAGAHPAAAAGHNAAEHAARGAARPAAEPAAVQQLPAGPAGELASCGRLRHTDRVRCNAAEPSSHGSACLQGLERLPHLTELDVSCNELAQVLDFALPAGAAPNLRTADLSHNCIGQIRWVGVCARAMAGQHGRSSAVRLAAAAYVQPPTHPPGLPCRDLSRFSRLKSLSLAGNSIEHITGLGALARLERLNLQDNSIRSCRGLEGCSSLLQLGGLLASAACNELPGCRTCRRLSGGVLVQSSRVHPFSRADLQPACLPHRRPGRQPADQPGRPGSSGPPAQPGRRRQPPAGPAGARPAGAAPSQLVAASSCTACHGAPPCARDGAVPDLRLCLHTPQGCERLSALEQLDASGNPISSLEALAPAAAARPLASLDVRRCPVQLVQGCRLHVLYLMPQLTVLDGRQAGPDEKVAAANMHGADAAGLVAIRNRY